MKILISGAGIAGPTLAYWLTHHGLEATIVEKSPQLRTGGYVVDFWGAGYDIADRMGLLPEIRRTGYRVQELRVVDRIGHRVAGFPTQVFSRITNDRFVTIARSDLAAAIFRLTAGKVETIFGDSIFAIDQSDAGARVRFESGRERDFDLVIGADGLHSNVRKLVCGPEAQFEKFLGFKVAAFEVEGYEPRDELVYVLYTEVGQQVGRFTMRNNRTLFLFTFSDPSPDNGDLEDQKRTLHSRFGNSGWECPQILEALDSSQELYFDRASQIHMNDQPGSWSRGRVALLGDAAFCVSLLAGQGTALAMIAAYMLAGEIHRAGQDYATAFTCYQERFGPFVRKKQDAALRFANSFAPKSAFSLFLRNQVMNLMRIPLVAQLAVGHDLADRITLPDYE